MIFKVTALEEVRCTFYVEAESSYQASEMVRRDRSLKPAA
jgi:hypothetical protein